MQEMREKVLALLKAYPEMKRQIALLQFEREHPAQVSEAEVIGGLALSRPIGETVHQPGYISDKTMRIAMLVQDETTRLNYETKMEIEQELRSIEDTIHKLEFYVSNLDRKQEEVIRLIYFELKTWREIQDELHISSRTLKNRRNDGINALTEMYQYMKQMTRCAKEKNGSGGMTNLNS